MPRGQAKLLPLCPPCLSLLKSYLISKFCKINPFYLGIFVSDVLILPCGRKPHRFTSDILIHVIFNHVWHLPRFGSLKTILKSCWANQSLVSSPEILRVAWAKEDTNVSCRHCTCATACLGLHRQSPVNSSNSCRRYLWTLVGCTVIKLLRRRRVVGKKKRSASQHSPCSQMTCNAHYPDALTHWSDH